MKPTLRQLLDWFSKDRVEYISHLATLLALATTVAFAWLGWREARLARQDQAEYFTAEKSPRLEVLRAYQVSGLVVIEVKNTGDSVLRSLRYQAFIQVPTSPAGMPHVTPREQAFEGKYSLQKSATGSLVFISVPELEKIIGYQPVAFELSSAPQTLHNNASIAITFVYSDIIGNTYPFGATLLLRRPSQ
jgi:hypothetical protein